MPLQKTPLAGPPFLHTPYDGSKQPFSVGLEPISEDLWLEPDVHLPAHLAYKAKLLVERRDRVFKAEADTLVAQAEAREMILAHLRAHQPAYRLVAGNPVPAAVNPNLLIGTTDDQPLVSAARCIQEDLILMRKGEDGYRIAAACLCFPSSWSLMEKFGQSMFNIHLGVPGFNNTRMGAMVDRIFANLQPNQLVARYNWSIYDDADLHHPQPKQLDPQLAGTDSPSLEGLYVRVERQTLRRLPASGDILFTIKVHHDPLALLGSHPKGPEWATSLRQQLLSLNPDQLAYKGLTRHRDGLAQALFDLAEKPKIAGRLEEPSGLHGTNT